MLTSETLEVMILVGGKGTRLRGVVDDRPKPMAYVAGRPFLEWLILALRDQKVHRIIFCTGYMAEMIESHFGDGIRWGMDFRYSRDPVPLGTGGAVRNALDQVSADRFIVINGDSYCAADIRLLAHAHVERRAAVTLWVMQVEDCRRYGTVLLDEDGQVQAFLEKSLVRRVGLINAGVYMIERNVMEKFERGQAVSLENDVFPSLAGNALFALVGEGSFLDIGTPESYCAAQSFFADGFLQDDGICS